VSKKEAKEMGNLLKTLMKQAESDAGKHADLLAMRGARLVNAEFEPFFLGQEICGNQIQPHPKWGQGKSFSEKLTTPSFIRRQSFLTTRLKRP
jgi:hypothetical protein